jgi:hypothetical protein
MPSIPRGVFAAVFVAAFAAAQESRPAHADPPDVRVRVSLQNGETLTGVAKRGVTAEVLEGGRFSETADVALPKAGLRLWYYRDLDGYLFLEYKRIANVEALGSLTREQSKELADAIASAKRVRDEARRAAEAARKKAEEEAQEGPESRPSDEGAQKPQGPELTAEEKALLDRFPPTEGWSPESFGELKRRSIVLDVYPNKNERDFLESFEEWRKAYAKREEIEAARAVKTAKSAPVVDGD